jgi:hypothetical protein
MDLQVPIVIRDETSDDVIESTGSLDLASGEIRGVQYAAYDVKSLGLPAEREDYEFTSGILSSDGKDVEFRIEVDIVSGRYSVSPSELLEIKVRAAKLFAGIEGEDLLKPKGKKGDAKPGGEPARRRKFH